jgi:flagellar basal-body rod protein FlgF
MSDINAQVSSAIDGLTNEYQIIANNLANVSTAGYKRTCNTFSKLLSERTGENTTAENENEEAGLCSKIDFTQGNFIESGRTLDVAINGKGFFVLQTAQGPLYTRSGNFDINKNGQLVDQSGRTVAGKDGPITIPAGSATSQINISNDGTVSLNGVNVGKLKVVDFGDNQNKLELAGLSCFSAPKTIVPTDSKDAVVKQGYLEGSNVQMVEELVDMITVSRLYEANMKFLAVGSDNTKSLMNLAMG